MPSETPKDWSSTMWSPSRSVPSGHRVAAVVVAVVGLVAPGCRPETTELKETPYKIAAERFGEEYCMLAFSEGCSVPDDCGVPAGFDDRADCRFRLVPFVRGCTVPEAEAEAVIEALEGCREAMETTTCDTSLCGGGTLDTEPCVSAFESLSSYCTFEGL
jgi:hypothetical protein